MTQNTEIFNETPSEGNPKDEGVPTPPTAPVIPPELVDFVGEGKKYASLNEVYKAFPHSQNHISNLEKELAELKEEVVRRKTAEELLLEIQNSQKVDDPVQAPPVQATTQIDLEQVVESVMQRKAVEETQKANASQVVEAFKAAYGEKAVEQYSKIAQANGIPVNQLDNMAKLSPQLVLNLAGLKPTKPSYGNKIVGDMVVAPVNTQVDTSAFKVKNTASTKDVANVWKAIRESVESQYNS